MAGWPGQTEQVNLREVLPPRLEQEVGPEARVVRWLVDHGERGVAEVEAAGGRRLALKADVHPARLEREAAALRAGGDGGVPLPPVVAWWAGPPAGLVLGWVDGTWLGPERPDAAWTGVGAQLARLHGVEVAGLGFYGGSPDWTSAVAAWLDDRWDTARRLGLGHAVDQLDRTLVDLLGHSAPPVGTLHGDCVPIHVRLDADDGVAGLLDLGDAMRGDPAWDLATLTLRSPQRLDAVLAGYGADAPLRRWVTDTVPAYRVLRHLTEAVWLADHGFNPAASVRSTSSALEGLTGA
jgi:aminoglycoside phosphotransferase (APT) family kinase protein